jgi:hypothetical protein
MVFCGNLYLWRLISTVIYRLKENLWKCVLPLQSFCNHLSSGYNESDIPISSSDPVVHLRGSSKSVDITLLAGVHEPSQLSRLVGPGRRVGLVGTGWIQFQLPVNYWCRFLKNLFQVSVTCWLEAKGINLRFQSDSPSLYSHCLDCAFIDGGKVVNLMKRPQL